MIKAVVCDIEGTTTALSFVKDTLFPYAREHMAGFIKQHCQEPDIAALISDVKQEMAKPNATLEDVITRLVAWIDQDKKITPLKAIQGHIWQYGYKNGDYHGHVYEDAYKQLKNWHDSGINLYIFSSGSVYAQKLLFGHTQYGDLNTLFEDYFDTTIGAKKDPEAYRAIALKIKLPCEAILFASDIAQELDAARTVGMRTVWLVREGKLMPDAAHPQVKSFHDIVL